MKKLYMNLEQVTLRQWVKNNFPWMSYERLQQALRTGDIRVNHQKITPQYELSPTDEILIWDRLTQQDNKTNVQISPKYWQNIALVDKNDDFWVVDKPYGVPTQGGNNIKVSMVEIMEGWMDTKPYPVHRLDRCTTGLLVMGTNSYAARELSRSILSGWNKVYLATVDGVVTRDGTMEANVDGKEAITKYKVIKIIDTRTILQLEPITGRKHQLRKHCAKFLYPIVGDQRYGEKSKERMNLRCVKLDFIFKGKTYRYQVAPNS